MLIKETKEDNKFECCFIELYLKVRIKIFLEKKKQRMRILGACIFSKFFGGKIKNFYMHLHGL